MSLQTPKYRYHKGSGQALVQINGNRIYLGKYNSEESKEKYRRLVAEWLKQGQPIAAPKSVDDRDNELTIVELILAFIKFAETYYVKNGKPTKELSCIREAIRPLRRLFGFTLAREFGPKSLKLVRQQMIDNDLSRKVINKHVGRIRRVFKWAVAEELVPPMVFHGLQALSGLRFGRTDAHETEPIKPIDDNYVDAVLPFVSPQVATMIKL